MISRRQAIEQGLKRYFTGKPCKYGHIAERNVLGTHCIICVAVYKRIYKRSEAGLASNRRYLASGKGRAVGRRYSSSEKGLETHRKRQRRYYANNREEILQKLRNAYNGVTYNV